MINKPIAKYAIDKRLKASLSLFIFQWENLCLLITLTHIKYLVYMRQPLYIFYMYIYLQKMQCKVSEA